MIEHNKQQRQIIVNFILSLLTITAFKEMFGNKEGKTKHEIVKAELQRMVNDEDYAKKVLFGLDSSFFNYSASRDWPVQYLFRPEWTNAGESFWQEIKNTFKMPSAQATDDYKGTPAFNGIRAGCRLLKYEDVIALGKLAQKYAKFQQEFKMANATAPAPAEEVERVKTQEELEEEMATSVPETATCAETEFDGQQNLSDDYDEDDDDEDDDDEDGHSPFRIGEDI